MRVNEPQRSRAETLCDQHLPAVPFQALRLPPRSSDLHSEGPDYSRHSNIPLDAGRSLAQQALAKQGQTAVWAV